ncbi:NAD-dependent epimerase/dehydratase family protein [Salinispira pacifica]|uniref:NAD-dependent epimerase/dehydratase family protein n=1 Tax=Salinispira pacifica TaxID=1307761 RepID=UPI00059D749C|nr:NAD(P)-dependent oxidoreductase [Salinispira pacifica]
MFLVTGAFGLLGTELMKVIQETGSKALIIERPGAKIPPSLMHRIGNSIRKSIRKNIRKIPPKVSQRFFSKTAARYCSGGKMSPQPFLWLPLDISHPGWSRYLPADFHPEAIFHLAALIPPAADRNPLLSERVNLAATRELIQWAQAHASAVPFIFTSSVAVYGDRRHSGEIFPDDPLHPSPGDCYARHKIAAEQYLAESGLPWNILRMSYIVSPRKLRPDPLMFHMPLNTRIEVIHASDAACALLQAFQKFRSGEILNIGGGEWCRTVYREYLMEMLSIFGLNPAEIPDDLFSVEPFHCGWMNTRRSSSYLNYQHHTLLDYYLEVYGKKRRLRWSVHRFRRFIWRKILDGSGYFSALPEGRKSRMIMSLMKERMSFR